MGPEIIAAIIAGLVGGAGLGWFGVNKSNKAKSAEIDKQKDLAIQESRVSSQRMLDDAESKAKKIVEKAERKNEQIKQKKISEAREKFNRMKSEFGEQKAQHKIDLKDREADVVKRENDVKQKESTFQSKIDKLNNRESDIEGKEAEIKSVRENLDKQLKVIAKKKDELDKANEQRIQALEKVAGLSEAEAKREILEAVKAKSETDAMAIIKESVEAAKATANKEAKKIVIQSIQRMCAEYTIENTVSVFNLDSDELKGQIIGREGRNIRALEAATGAEIVVDDTPEAIVISSFDPIRREVCRLSLKRLVADGRIHPARIEEVVAKTKKQLDEQIREIGERTVIELDIH